MKMTLGKQLGLNFGLLLAFTFLIFLSGYRMSDWIVEQYETEVIRNLETSGMAKDLNTEVLQIRRREKDFLQRNELKYAEQTQTHVAQAIALAKKIEQGSSDNEIQQWVRQARKEATHYGENFKSLQAAVVARGLDENSGAQGHYARSSTRWGRLANSTIWRRSKSIICKSAAMRKTIIEQEPINTLTGTKTP